MRGKWLLVVGIVVVLAAGAGAIYWLQQQNRPASARATNASPANPFSGPVASLPGRIEAVEVVPVPVPFPGKLESLPVDVGAQVAEGDLLAEIRSSSLESQKDGLNNELNRIRSRASALESNLIAARLEASRAREAAEGARAAMEDAAFCGRLQAALRNAG